MIDEKKSIQKLVNYQTKDVPYQIKLDANEGKNFLFPNGFDFSRVEFHRYPDDQATLLRSRLSKYLSVPSEMIVEGNGSSELIELLIKTYVNPDDVVLSIEPTFSMYRIYSEIYSARYIGIPSQFDFSIDLDQVITAIHKFNPKIVFLCSPNNPTGYQMKRAEITRIVESTQGLVVVDEAYIEFANRQDSVLQDIVKYSNLVILRTFSKAFGLASIRLGYLVGPEMIVKSLSKVKSPYHLNALTQAMGSEALLRIDTVEKWVSSVIAEREKMINSLNELGIQTFPASGNFIWIQTRSDLGNRLEEKGILIRSYQNALQGYYRITIGTEAENLMLIQAIKEIFHV